MTLQDWYNQNSALVSLMLIGAISAMSYQVALRSGFFAFISAGFWGIGAYLSANIAIRTSLPWPVSIGVGLVLGALGGLILSVALLRLRGQYLAMATFAFDLVVSIVAEHLGGWTGGAAGLAPIPVQLTVTMLVVLLLVTCFVMSRLEVGRLGRAQEVIHVDPELAVSLGIKVTYWRHVIFAISGMLGALAGSMYALTFYAVDPSQIGFGTLIAGIATVVIGGTASWRGCLLGVIVVIGFPGQFQSLQIWTPVIYGGLLVVVAVFLPDGLFGLWQRRLRVLRWVKRRPGGSVDPLPPRNVPAGTEG